MTPVSPVKVDVDVQPDHSCNNWKCCYGCRCLRKIKKEDKAESPFSVEIVERVTHTYERQHHAWIPVIIKSPIPRLHAPSPLLLTNYIDLPAHLASASQANFRVDDLKEDSFGEITVFDNIKETDQ